jgi:uridylate kinase
VKTDNKEIKKEGFFQKPSRLLIKISGEYFQSDASSFDVLKAYDVARQLKELMKRGHQIVIVLGGGNFFRGEAFCKKNQLSRETADRMGMMATVMNTLAFQSVLETSGMKVCSYCSYTIENILPSFQSFEARKQLAAGSIVICAGGLGIPFLTTDTTAVMRSLELSCDVVLKGTKPDGVFSQDPFQFPDAVFYPHITYAQALKENLQVMDQVAFHLAQEQNMILLIFSLYKESALLSVIDGKIPFSLVTA